MAEQDSDLVCTVCGRTSTTNFASSLRSGWEKCCGYTMRLEKTRADIDKAVEGTVASRTLFGKDRSWWFGEDLT